MADLKVMGVVVKSRAGLAQRGNVVLPGLAALPMATAIAATFSTGGATFEVAVRRGPYDQRRGPYDQRGR